MAIIENNMLCTCDACREEVQRLRTAKGPADSANLMKQLDTLKEVVEASPMPIYSLPINTSANTYGYISINNFSANTFSVNISSANI